MIPQICEVDPATGMVAYPVFQPPWQIHGKAAQEFFLQLFRSDASIGRRASPLEFSALSNFAPDQDDRFVADQNVGQSLWPIDSVVEKKSPQILTAKNVLRGKIWDVSTIEARPGKFARKAPPVKMGFESL